MNLMMKKFVEWLKIHDGWINYDTCLTIDLDDIENAWSEFLDQHFSENIKEDRETMLSRNKGDDKIE